MQLERETVGVEKEGHFLPGEGVGADRLAGGANELYQGIGTLRSGVDPLTDGIAKLRSGADELNQGMIRFNEEGIQQIASAADDALPDLLARFRAVQEAAADYNSFSGIASGMDGKVRFLYLLDGTEN